jgi:hypothetical protein
MNTEEKLMEAAKLRLRLQMNNRLRLELLAAISRLFREHEEPMPDDLLASIVLAVPEELRFEMEAAEPEPEDVQPASSLPSASAGLYQAARPPFGKMPEEERPIGKPPLGKPPLGKPPLGLPATFPLLFAVCLAMVTAYFFQKGLNYYVQKGINRYYPTGHRR